MTQKKTVTPQEFTEDMYNSENIAGLGDFLSMVKLGQPWVIPTQRLIRLNGNSRRGRIVNQQINEHLRNRGLICTPTVENADYYGDVIVSDPRDELVRPETVASMPISAFRGDFPDLISCGPEMQAVKVQTLMIKDDLSQIPVLSQDKKTLYGVVTWRSLARFQGPLGSAKASDVMSRSPHVASSADDFLDLVNTVISQEFVLYRAPDGKVDGIVTASDLAQAFNDTAGIFIRIGEIEDRLRILLDKSPIPKLKQHLDPRRSAKQIFRGAIDMTFGEYLNALRDADVWVATGIDLDQDTCLRLLDTIREARNKIMHFSSDLDVDAHRAVERCLRILRAIPLA